VCVWEDADDFGAAFHLAVEPLQVESAYSAVSALLWIRPPRPPAPQLRDRQI